MDHKTINEIKDNHLKIISSIDMNVSAITLNKNSSSYEHLKFNLMPWKILKSLGTSPKLTNILSSMYHNGNNQLQIRKQWVPLRSAIFCFRFLSRLLSITLNNQHQVSTRENTQRDRSLLQNNNASEESVAQLFQLAKFCKNLQTEAVGKKYPFKVNIKAMQI